MGTICRSPNSRPDNDNDLLTFINNFSSSVYDYKLLLGDFNCPNINWQSLSSSVAFDKQFLDTLRKNFLCQFVSVPTRSRGMDTPYILDLVISSNIIDNIECESPLGKSDHSVLLIECNLKDDVQKTATADKYAYSKGNYRPNDLFNSLNDVSWDRLLHPCKNNIDDMWQKTEA